MTNGLELKFHSRPPLWPSPPSWAHTSERQEKIISPFIPKYLERGIIREIHKPFPPMFYSRMFSRPKKNGSHRPIIDLSSLNKFLIIPRFKMETVSSISKSLCHPLWGCKVDLTDAFQHVPLHWLFHKFFAFVIGKGIHMRVFVFQYLPFGLSTAPWAFSRVIRPIKRHIRSILISLHSYLDDFLILASSPDNLSSVTQIVLDTLKGLGFSINMEKSDLAPRQVIEYLGVLFNLKDLSLSLPEDKVKRISSLCQSTVVRSSCSRRELEQLVGTLNFAAAYIPLGRLHLLPVIKWMNRETLPFTRDRQVPIDEHFRSLLKIWQDQSFLRSPVPMHISLPSKELMTDASLTGWCGVLLPHRVWDLWPSHCAHHQINWLELKAIHLTLWHFRRKLRGHTVLLWCDNVTAISCIKHQGTLYSDLLLSLTTEVLELCSQLSITLVPRHLKGVLNVLADQGSRDLPVDTEWSLDTSTYHWVSRLPPLAPQVDLFATRDNSHLPEFVSPCPDLLAAGIDALTLDWNRWTSIYLFPPVAIIKDLLPHLEAFSGTGVLIAPHYEGSALSLSLNRRCLRRFKLPRNFCLSQLTTRGVVVHPNPSALNLHAWVLFPIH